MATLHFLCGKAGAGKSTLAHALAAEHAATLIAEDVWLMRLFGDRMQTFDDYRVYSRKLKTVVGPLTVDLLRSGRSVVLDYPANTVATRAWFRSLFEEAQAVHLLHVLPASDELCLQRIARRNIERPEGSHHLTEEQFHHVSSFFEPPQADEGFAISVHA